MSLKSHPLCNSCKLLLPLSVTCLTLLHGVETTSTTLAPITVPRVTGEPAGTSPLLSGQPELISVRTRWTLWITSRDMLSVSGRISVRSKCGRFSGFRCTSRRSAVSSGHLEPTGSARAPVVLQRASLWAACGEVSHCRCTRGLQTFQQSFPCRKTCRSGKNGINIF